MYIAMTLTAGPLIVMEVVTPPRSIPANSWVDAASVSTATPARPTSPTAQGVGVPAHEGGHVERRGEPGDAGRQQVVKAAVGIEPAASPKPANIRIVQSLSR